ncbi:zinc finger MYM-type protein 1-like [Olea europaea var. sylvestris]|uniref:zinc finger MYM-type protein 1-like n=1 Tax=Olea europaea var. sylvestris TaxID=158386 RepID=UPI000C1D690D|nr:zinc finger MYM-type protein 1-like [Olea europaea var. sylvestris]
MVGQGSKSAFLVHIGTTSSSYHNGCKRRVENLMKSTQHIDKVMHAISSEEKQKNRLCLLTTIMSVRWLALQVCSFIGNDESPSSLNCGNFLEMVDGLGKMNTKIGEVMLGNTSKNATYTSLDIQKEILSIMANRVRHRILKELGDAKFSILVDEARDASSQEQMTIILKFVKVQNMRGQGYDGANNMRGAWNGLQALFLRDCPYAYYVHCFAHSLQLTLVSAARNVAVNNSFFSDLDNVINMITSSPKHINELKSTRWSSHYNSVKSLIDMYAATCKVLEYLSDHSPNLCFVKPFKKKKTQDILTVMRFVHTAKTIIQELRENGWEEFLEEVNFFAGKMIYINPTFMVHTWLVVLVVVSILPSNIITILIFLMQP